jgi:hypothetical protein
MSSLGFRSANLDFNPQDSVTYDMLRIGTTWADVVPVPEPATVIVGALLLLPFPEAIMGHISMVTGPLSA